MKSSFPLFMLKNKRIILFVVFVMLAGFWVQPNFLWAAMSSSNYQIWSDVFSEGGGEDTTSANYRMQDTIGEGIVGNSSSTNYGMKAGFRQADYFEGMEVLTLSVGAATLELGTLSSSAASTASHTLTVDTNSHYGASVTYSGTTLTSGVNTIAGMGATALASSPGSSQFGFNAIYVSGASPAAAATAQYNNAAKYAFSSGDQIISSTAGINSTVFNINYIANITSGQTAGTYTTTITFTATANF